MTPHARGLLLTFVGVVVLTPDTLLVRLVASDPWTVTAWRGLLYGCAVLAGFFVVRRGAAWREIRGLGANGLALAGLHCANAVLFVLALHHTSAANTLIILATTPLIAALMSFAVLGERISTPTWLAIVSALAGIGIVAHDGVGRGTLVGDVYALLTAALLAASFVLIRRRRDLNLVPATGLGALLSGLAVLPGADVLTVSATQLPFVLVMGLFVLPVAFVLLTLGPRTLPAPEVALLLLLETVLGPLWVWLGVGERPTPAAFVGGGIVLATLILHSAWRLRRRAPAPAAAARTGASGVP